MKMKRTACLLAALALSVSNISYAEEAGNQTEAADNQAEAKDNQSEAADNQTEAAGSQTEAPKNQTKPADNQAEASDNQAEPQPGNQTGPKNQEKQTNGNERVVWGQGSGITPYTVGSEQDQFAPVVADKEIVSIEPALKNAIEAYMEKNASELNLGEKTGEGQLSGTQTAFYDFDNGMIFTSDKGTYSIRMPLLNTFITSGGVERLGAPVEEEKIENGRVRQKFENGNISCEVENTPDTLVVRRGNKYYFKNSLSNGEADEVAAYGRADDQVLVGDWDGDGKDTLCVRRGNVYYFKNSISGGEADAVIRYGRAGDEVLAGDWDGDGKDTLCVRRGNTYYVKNSISEGTADKEIKYGRAGDQVLVGDWDADGKDTFCVRRGNTYYMKNSISDGVADKEVKYGRAGDEVLVGDWDGDGKDTLCVRRGNAYYIKNVIGDGEADTTVLYGRKNDVTYAGTWTAPSKIKTNSAENMKFNTSHGFSYSRLTQAFAGNSVNATSFRRSSITSHIDAAGNQTQYCAYYDYKGNIVLAKRSNDGPWSYQWTDFMGDISDAHNVVSLAVDGAGYLHMAWSRHSGSLMYAKSDAPGSMIMKQTKMIGTLENRATYPEFYVQPSGDMFFLYRNGSAGNGNIVLNRYIVSSGSWQRVQDNLISGEDRISPYWQACVDSKGRLHISWVWRETGDASTNYNISYTMSVDDTGSTFVNSAGEPQILPITESTSETICEIPKNSALINQTSMTTDGEDKPYIISYWRVNGVVQYNILRFTGTQWIIYNTDIRNSDFQLSGSGTVKLPCARPQILVDGVGDDAKIFVLFRDNERGGKASIAKLSVQDKQIKTEKMIDITDSSMGEWEPNYDIALWKQSRKLNIFMQKEYFNPDGIEKESELENIYVMDATPLLSE